MTSIYRGSKVWFKDDESAGNPPFIVTEVETVTPELLNLTLRQFDTETGKPVGLLIDCTSDEVLTSPHRIHP